MQLDTADVTRWLQSQWTWTQDTAANAWQWLINQDTTNLQYGAGAALAVGVFFLSRAMFDRHDRLRNAKLPQQLRESIMKGILGKSIEKDFRYFMRTGLCSNKEVHKWYGACINFWDAPNFMALREHTRLNRRQHVSATKSKLVRNLRKRAKATAHIPHKISWNLQKLVFDDPKKPDRKLKIVSGLFVRKKDVTPKHVAS